MASRSDGTEVPHGEALAQWASVAYGALKNAAHSYNQVIGYAELSQIVQAETDLWTRMLVPNWIGSVLEIAAQQAADAEEPPLTSLCLHADGTIGDGYERAPKYGQASTAADIELRAAEDRLLCYQRFAADLPSDGGTPTLTPEVELQRRKSNATGDATAWLDRLIRTGSLSVGDRVPFHDHLEVGRLFGRSYKGHQSATIRLDEFTEVWFPEDVLERRLEQLPVVGRRSDHDAPCARRKVRRRHGNEADPRVRHHIRSHQARDGAALLHVPRRL